MTYTKINWKLTKNLNVRPGTMRLLEENIDSKLLDNSLNNIALDYVSLVKENKSKSKQRHF